MSEPRDLPDFDAMLENQWLRYQEAQEGVLARECRGCGRLWSTDVLDEDGYCKQCAEYNREDSK